MENFNGDMLITQKLKKIWKNKEKIIIEGINSLGEDFETYGYIFSESSSKPSISSNSLTLAFGKTFEYGETDFSSNFSIFPDDKKINFEDLYILKIKDKDGNLIFENNRKNELNNLIKEFFNTNQQKLNISHRNIEEDDDVTKSLKNMFGKPVIIYDGVNYAQGVLSCIRGLDLFGNVLITIKDNTKREVVKINENTKLFTVDENSKEILLADNSKRIENNKIILKRKEKLNIETEIE